MNVPIDWPKVYWADGDDWVFSWVEAGRAKQVSISKRNAAILAKSIGDAFEREYRDASLIEWDKRVAV
jgi:hypothetical protein